MRVAVVSDIHSNLAALQAVVADFGQVDEVWCLGDVIGYGPEPNECVALVRQLPRLACVAGNHDWAGVGKLPLDDFNEHAREAAAWTAGQLTAVARAFIVGLPTRLERGGCTLVHGSPREPVTEYLLRTWRAAECFRDFATQTCFVGHSHVPLIFQETPTGSGARYVDPDYDAPLQLGQARRIVNPGSVGQPRDGNPDASYALLDPESGQLQFRRVPYDVAATQARMRAAGLPNQLWQRLTYGL